MKNHWKIVISVLFILSFSSVNMRAQNAYVFSSISYYESTGEVDLEVGVSVDYQAFLYYSPDVQTFLYEQNTQIGTTSGVNDFYLFLDLSRSAKANTNYSSETAAGVNVRYNNYWNSFTDMFNYQSFTPVDTTNSAAWFGPGPKVEFPEVYVWLGIVRSFITTPAPQLTIVLPTSGTLISQDSNSNSSLTVQAYSNYPGVVSWHGTVSYSTRVNSIPNGGIAHGPFDSYFNDTSNSGSQKTVTLPSVGGSVTSLSASLTFPGRTLPTTTSVSSVALISGIQGGIGSSPFLVENEHTPQAAARPSFGWLI